ncbi:MAG: hypothetical protein M1830_004711 [Pleopsidium flavum]|nr:MAG: hypothetical protein M1830_004711 [Pleopsidium flavum]
MWTHLPVELWDLILHHVAQKDLATLNSVCETLHILTEPLLYAEIRWTEGEPSEVSQRSPRIHLLLRSILNRPELAFHIKHAHFRSYFVFMHWEQPNLIPSLWQDDGVGSGFTPKEMATAEGLIERAKLCPKKEWREELQRGASDVIIAILLSQLSKLERLDLEVPGQTDERPLVGSIFRQALTSAPSALGLPRFESLKAVDVSVDGRNIYCFHPKIDFDTQVASLFDLPAVESLTISWLAPEPPIWPGRQPITPTLTTLIFKNSRLDENILGQLLAATPNLKRLECPLAYDVEIDEYCRCAKLRSALEQIETTIESLTISVKFWSSGEKDETWGLYPGVVGSIGSMKEYTRLKHLEMPLVVLLGWYPDYAPWLWDVLPEQLETICCRDDMTIFETYKWSREEMLEEFTDYLSGASVLKEFTLSLREARWGERYDSELRQVCEAAGVACRIVAIKPPYEQGENMNRLPRLI